MYASVPVSVANKYLAIGAECQVCRFIEGFSLRTGFIGCTERHQQFAFRRKLPHDVCVTFRTVDIIVGINENPMCILEDVVTPKSQ